MTVDMSEDGSCATLKRGQSAEMMDEWVYGMPRRGRPLAHPFCPLFFAPDADQDMGDTSAPHYYTFADPPVRVAPPFLVHVEALCLARLRRVRFSGIVLFFTRSG